MFSAFLKKIKDNIEFSATKYINYDVTLVPNIDISNEILAELGVTEEEYNLIRTNVENILGSDDAYLEVFMEDFRYSDEPITAFISENIADIYQELNNLVSNWQIDNDDIKHDALAICMEAFKEHWGQKLVNVLRPLHALSLESNEEIYY